MEGRYGDQFRIHWPALGTVRGKIVMTGGFSEGYFMVAPSFHGAYCADGDTNPPCPPTVHTTADIDDFWNVNKQVILEISGSCPDNTTLYYVGADDWSAGAYPYTVAGGFTSGRCQVNGASQTVKGVNQYALELLRNPATGGGHWNVHEMVFDLSGGYLIESVILHNPFVFVDGSYAAVYNTLGFVPYPVGCGRDPASTVGQAVAAVAAANACCSNVHPFTIYVNAGRHTENVQFDKPVRVKSQGGAARIGTP
jgi:hypothetical protein